MVERVIVRKSNEFNTSWAGQLARFRQTIANLEDFVVTDSTLLQIGFKMVEWVIVRETVMTLSALK